MYVQGIHLSMVHCVPICASLIRVCDKERISFTNMQVKVKKVVPSTGANIMAFNIRKVLRYIPF
jgi:hypothetical protein